MLKEVRVWRQILHTIDALLTPFYTLLMIQFLIFYLFSIVGDRIFGGDVTMNDNPMFQEGAVSRIYVNINFNDTLSSFLALFSLMFNIETLEITLQNTFFLVYYFISVIVIINIIVAFVIDIYEAIDQIYKEKEELNNKKDHKDSTFLNDSDHQRNPHNNSEKSSELINNTVRKNDNHEIKIGVFDSLISHE